MAYDEKLAGRIIDNQAAQLARMQAALEAMLVTPYEQPIGVWFYVIKKALGVECQQCVGSGRIWVGGIDALDPDLCPACGGTGCSAHD